MPAAWVAAAGGVLGAINSGHSGGSQTTQNTLDPRIANFLYGGDGFYGLLNRANDIEGAQTAQGGLNPMQQAGLEMQRQTLMDPAYTQGYGQMRSLGSSMLGQGVAGNPFLSMNGPRAMPSATPSMQTPASVGPGFGAGPASVMPIGPGSQGLGGLMFGPDQQRIPGGTPSAAYQPIQPQIAPTAVHAPAAQPDAAANAYLADLSNYYANSR